VTLGAHTRMISASIGISLCPADACTVDRLIGCADEAMYGAKHRGAPYAFYNPRAPDGAD
jgi:GGDEF domain-containing protein